MFNLLNVLLGIGYLIMGIASFLASFDIINMEKPSYWVIGGMAIVTGIFFIADDK